MAGFGEPPERGRIKVWSLAVLGGALLFASQLVAAQPEMIRFERISLEQGLAQSTVHAVAQDADGFMWFGTGDGLNRFDGYHMQTFKHDPGNPSSLSDNLVNSIFLDSKKRLWVGTYGGGLNQLNPDGRSFSRKGASLWEGGVGLEHRSIVAICEDASGRLWIATNTAGILVWDPERGTRNWLSASGQNPLLPSNEVNAILAVGGETVWAATSAGLCSIRTVSLEVERISLSAAGAEEPEVLALAADREGNLWLGLENGQLAKHWRANEGSAQFELFEPLKNISPTQPFAIHALLLDKNGILWLGSEGAGLISLNPATAVVTGYPQGQPDSLSDVHVLSLFQDRGGVVWVGTYGGGLNKFNPQIQGFRSYHHRAGDPNGLSADLVVSFLEDRFGKIWVGTIDNGLDLFDPVKASFEHIAPSNRPGELRGERVAALLEDRAGVVWVGTSLGLNRYERENHRFDFFGHNPTDPTSIAEGRVMCLLEDSSGRLWVGTFKNGLDLMDREKNSFRHFMPVEGRDDSLSNSYITTLAEDEHGRILVGTDAGGLNILDPETFHFERIVHDPVQKKGLSHNSVSCFLLDHEQVWVGTFGGGLNLVDLRTKEVTHFREADGLPNESIYGILRDAYGELWISTNKGLSRFSPEKRSFKNYDATNGLQSNEFNVGAYLLTRSGEMYFGGVNGFNRFHPDDIRGNQHVPPIALTSVRKFNQEIPFDGALSQLKSVTLEPGDVVFSVSVAALDFTNSSKNRFAYKLEGFNDDWIQLGESRDITYTNLDPGSYLLRVIGSNNDGVWNEEGLSLKIKVKPPQWRSWWAYLIYLTLVSLGLGLYLRARERSKRKELVQAVAVGKAEFATTVLHNIGNILNSISVSCDQVEEVLDASKFPALQRAFEMLRKHEEHVLDFLTNDPKGRILPKYFVTAGPVLVEEQQEIRTEFGEIRQKLRLMKEIIETQQHAAKTSLVTEPQDLNRLVDDALKVQEDSLRKREIAVKRDFSELPEIKIHKIQMTHVLINLIKNAAEAMEQANVTDKELRLTTRKLPGRVQLTLRDNGMGIRPEDLGKLFTYGFTTKKSGHGFGLHYCAKAIRDMGGTIEVHSEGLGQGASFLIEFPTMEKAEPKSEEAGPTAS